MEAQSVHPRQMALAPWAAESLGIGLAWGSLQMAREVLAYLWAPEGVALHITITCLPLVEMGVPADPVVGGQPAWLGQATCASPSTPEEPEQSPGPLLGPGKPLQSQFWAQACLGSCCRAWGLGPVFSISI